MFGIKQLSGSANLASTLRPAPAVRVIADRQNAVRHIATYPGRIAARKLTVASPAGQDRKHTRVAAASGTTCGYSQLATIDRRVVARNACLHRDRAADQTGQAIANHYSRIRRASRRNDGSPHAAWANAGPLESAVLERIGRSTAVNSSSDPAHPGNCFGKLLRGNPSMLSPRDLRHHASNTPARFQARSGKNSRDGLCPGPVECACVRPQWRRRTVANR
jgi:hypothetical protein